MREASKTSEMFVSCCLSFCSKDACVGKHVLVTAASNSTVMSGSPSGRASLNKFLSLNTFIGFERAWL